MSVSIPSEMRVLELENYHEDLEPRRIKVCT